MAMVAAMGCCILMAPSALKPKVGFTIKGLHTLQRASKMRVVGSLQEKVPSFSLSQEEELSIEGSALAGALFAAMSSANSALAAQQISELAATDNRGIALFLPLVPATGWVLFNILKPALNQFNSMKSVKGLAMGLGLGTATSCMFASQASALQEIADIGADNDSRGILLLVVLVPAIGWVLFNILKPALNQFSKMKALVGGLGLGALSMLSVPRADAVDEIATLAEDTDSRGTLVLLVLVPAIGWVLFNILQPALNQLDRMKSKK